MVRPGRSFVPIVAVCAACSSSDAEPGATSPPPSDDGGRASPIEPEKKPEEPECKEGDCAPEAPPTPTDGVKNGDETDVDCGGANAPKCEVGKKCEKHTDCKSDACPSKVCLSSRSCKQHFGGDTCGAGEVGQDGAKHEDCCLSIRPGEHDFRVDKYLVTAGRMRAFIDEVRAENGGVPNVRAWVAAHPDRVPNWQAAWNVSLPSSEAELVQMIGTGHDPGAYWTTAGQANGCYVGGQGAPTYWHSAANLSNFAGDVARVYTQEQLDVKVLNCTPAAMFAAFCAYDGGRLPTSAEWLLAVRGKETAAERLFPWGNPVAPRTNTAAVNAEIAQRASYNKNYQFPPTPAGLPADALAADGRSRDRGFEVPAPGRFPLGAGPFGHADLLGVAETMVFDQRFVMIRQYAFQEAYYNVQAYGNLINRQQYTSHYAVAARCARPL
ncbi:MAG: SUMF1/EgtB/PvdO family nonheme iron enzyme [Labilithrix sp.]|nr:SUMF1/EgtB/PvdO family nonheme iron enzyme [Labilithrix sp.]MCW5812860.1 SUMF1/EgtB/PvdO family nonheme iron enzyme [Labilithrix sp.]